MTSLHETIDNFKSLSNLVGDNNNNNETRERFEEAREKIRVHQAEITGKAMDRNFYQFTRAGERMTRYHFSRMVKKHESRDISK